jgi:hypothetical protein
MFPLFFVFELSVAARANDNDTTTQVTCPRNTKAHHYRAENPLAHLHEDEAPVETDKLKSFH